MILWSTIRKCCRVPDINTRVAAAMSIPGEASASTIVDSADDPDLMRFATRSDVNRSAAVDIQTGASEQAMVKTCPLASRGVSSSAAGAAEHNAQQVLPMAQPSLLEEIG